MSRKRFLFPIILLFYTFFLPTPARADGIIIPEPPIPCRPCPRPFPISGQLDIRYHRVTVTIEDQIALTRVDQVFHNPNDWTVEGTYIFPLPKDAVVSNFKLWIDGKPVEGEVLSAEEARRKYEEIVRQRIDPALLEYVDQGAVQARIFPIEPGEERRIELEYSQVLAADSGLVRYTYPLNTEKFSRTPLENVSISVDIRASASIRAVYSPSHSVATSRESENHVTVGYEDSDVLPDSDFVLYYSLGETEAFHLLTFRDPSDPRDPDGFYLLLLAPRPDVQTEPIAKDILLVLDQSGSMEGEKYRQAQDAAAFILEHLNPEDHFNVLTFSTGVRAFADRLRPAAEAEEAIQWVQHTSAQGSTDINRALLEALSLTNNERPTFIIFLTDGLPTEGEIDPQRILDNFSAAATPNIRLFAFGVGYDVDTFLLDSLAQTHHGTTTYVVPGERIDETVSAFYQKVSTPVLTDLRLEFDGVTIFDQYPDPLPDLFVGSQIIAVGRYRNGGTATATLSGSLNGETQTFTFPNQTFVTQSSHTDLQSTIPRLWATRKIGHLLNFIRLHGPDQETIDQIVRLSIRYGIVTPYTSYLVTEPLALGEEAQSRIARDQFKGMMATPSPSFSGQEAVEKAAAQGQLAEAEVIEAPPAGTSDQVRFAGNRTFVLTDGVWVDTTFDPDKMTTIKVPFLSDDYFALLASRPDLGDAFALGERVIAFADGNAYEVVPADTTTTPLQIPPSQTPPQIAQGDTPTPGGSYPSGFPSTQADYPSPPEAQPPTSAFPCTAAALPLLALTSLFVFRRRRTD